MAVLAMVEGQALGHGRKRQEVVEKVVLDERLQLADRAAFVPSSTRRTSAGSKNRGRSRWCTSTV
jgi:hypothetical protein